MNAAEALRAAQARGLQLRVVGDRLRIRPADALDPRLREQFVRLKPEILPMVRVLEALEYGPMKAHELVAATCVDLGTLYPALGALYDAGFVKTDTEAWYYLPAQYTRPSAEHVCPSCRDPEARGRRVLACRVCDVRVN